MLFFRSIYATVRNQYCVHTAVQSWRFDKSASWVFAGRHSLTSNRVDMAQQTYGRGIAKPMFYRKNYKIKLITLTSNIFSQLQDLWAITDKSFDSMKDRWTRQTHKTIPMKDWIPTRGRPLTSKELQMKTMTADVKV